MTPKEEAEEILRKGKPTILRELIGYIKRVKYLEGKEFYESIAEDIKQEQAKKIIEDIKFNWLITKHFDGDYVKFYNTQIRHRIKELENSWLGGRE